MTDLADTLDDVVNHLRRFVYFPDEHAPVAVALWCAHTWAIEACDQSPILAAMSAVRRSGKTRLIDVVQTLVARPWHAIRPSEAVFFRRIDRDKPTCLLDEVDTIFNKTTDFEGLRACLNAGNRRGATIPRAVAKGKTFDLVDFEIYCAKLVAGIGTLPDTIGDRAILIEMVRKAPGDPIERLRVRDGERLGLPLAERLEAAMAGVTDLSLPNDRLPDELDDRAQDGWEPLLAVADRAGGTWPARGRAAAVALSTSRSEVDDESLGIVLLRDIESSFGTDLRLTTNQLIERLVGIELAPWSDMFGKPITGRKLARLLRPFGIRPHRDRVGTVYAPAMFADAWGRYLPHVSAPPSATSATTTTADIPDTAVVAVVAGSTGEGATKTATSTACPSCLHPMVATPSGRLVCTNAPGHPGHRRSMSDPMTMIFGSDDLPGAVS